MIRLIIFYAFLIISSQALQIRVFPGGRPAPHDRKFTSQIIEEVITNVTSILKDQALIEIFERCFPNTLDTTVEHFTVQWNKPDTFIITGDIDAMWLRDSTNQVFPYVQFVLQDDKLDTLIQGVVYRQVNQILLDTYANAYNYGPTGSPWDSDKTTKIDKNGNIVNGMTPFHHERKYEIDSLAAFLKLSNEYYRVSENDIPINLIWIEALDNILNTLEDQQTDTDEEDIKNRIMYTFSRQSTEPTESLPKGRIGPSSRTGMVRSAFRPSDDACTYPYFVPGNAMLVVELSKTAKMLRKIRKDDAFNKQADILANKSDKIASQIDQGIKKFGMGKDIDGNDVYVYEVDGFGNQIKMDDANVPSLLSLPFLGYVDIDDIVYQNTRKMILSRQQNPYFFKGQFEGIGGPHVGDKMIWPMSLILRAFTTNDDKEIMECLDALKNTTANTGFMHESFNVDDPNNFSRKWFAWANTLFGQLILHILETKPYLLT